MHALRRFLVFALGFAVLTLACTTDKATEPPTPGSINGQVSETGSGAPISGVSVSTQPATSSVTTDAQGHYSITGVQPGSYAITASRTDYTPGSANVSVVAGQTATANITLTPLPTTGTISGQVTDASTSQPIAGATVTTQPATSTALTDAQGNYSIANVTPGSSTVTAAKAGYNSNSTAVVVTADQTSTANLALTPTPPPPDFNGRWVGTTSQNRPLTLWVGPAGVMDSLRVQISVPIISGISSCLVTFTPVNVSLGSDGSFTAALASPTLVSGTLSGTFGTGTTASGAFQAGWSGGIICGGTLTIGGGGSASGTWQATKSPTGTISGRVTDASSSQPIAGATVGTQPVTATVTTDAQGNYIIPNVNPGSYTVNAAKSGYQNGLTNATVVTGQTATANIALTPLPPTGAISGQVTDANNSQPIAGATVSTQPVTATVTTDAQGNYTILSVAPGGYTVTAAKSGYQNGATSVTVAAGQTTTANLQLALTATKLFLSPILDFKLSPNPTPRTSASVLLCLSTMEWSATLAEDMVGTSYTFSLGVRTSTTSTGTGTLQADIIHKRGSSETLLASTTFTTTTTYEVKTASFTGPDPDALAGDILLLRARIVPPSPGLPCVAEFIGPGTDNFIEVPRTTVQLLPTTGTIAGRVTDANNSQPIAGATVSTQPVTATVTTDGQGNYTIPSVVPGGYAVTVAKSGYQNGSASTTVVAGQTATRNIALTPLPSTGTISGLVTDASTSQPIAGATVTTQPATATVTTDGQGNYAIPNVAPGVYTVIAAKSGYQSGSAAATVTAGETTTADIALSQVVGDYAGEWRGTTSQSEPVYFRVNQSGQIDSLTVRLRMDFPTFTCTATFPAAPPITIASGKFDAFLSIAPITNISTFLHGSFSSATTISGTWDSFSENWLIQGICGVTLGLGTGTTLQAGTWTAQKQ